MPASTNDLIYYRGQLLHQITCLLTYVWSYIESIFMDINSVRYGTYLNEGYLLKHRHIDNLDNECEMNNTRFNKSELRTILRHLRVPTDLKNIYTLSGETLFLILLVYIAQAIPLYNMVNLFGGNPREFGNFYKRFFFNVYDTFYH